ncbi:MAG: PIN domain-containing protein [Fibromonadales bacterium]|nr:PIN domain-containing protein [Fibromonadales bacterium]
MKTLLVDLNVILDYLNHREDFENAEKIFDFCIENENCGFVCAHEITTLAYFLYKKDKDSKKARDSISTVLDILKLVPTSEFVLRLAIVSMVDDYEDAVIESSAIQANIDYIITRNIDDFANSRIKAITPAEFLEIYGEAKNEP